MAVNILGVAVMMVFYLLVLGVGIWASVKSKREESRSAANKMDMALLGNRSINKVVGIFTMTATWVGGCFIMGLSEMTYTPSMGLTSAIIMLTAFSFCFILGGLVFAKPMRDNKYVTMLDPFNVKYGKAVLALQSLCALLIDFLWLSGLLIGLGGTTSVILDLSYTVSIWISVIVIIVYTLLGGLYSVAYTDIIQLVLIFITLRFWSRFLDMMKRALKLNQRQRRMSRKWKATQILIQTLRRLTSQQMERERHLMNRHLRRHSSPRVDTCSGLHPPRTEEVEREWKTSTSRWDAQITTSFIPAAVRLHNSCSS